MIIFLILLVLTIFVATAYFLFTLFQLRTIKPQPDNEGLVEYTSLRIDVPKNNEKAPLAAEQMFASIHGIYSESSPKQEHLSFEILAKDKYIQFYVRLPKHIRDFVEGQIYAQYPTVEIKEVPDYVEQRDISKTNFATC